MYRDRRKFAKYYSIISKYLIRVYLLKAPDDLARMIAHQYVYLFDVG